MVIIARPPVMVLLAMFAATGLAQGGDGGSDPVRFARVLAAVIAFLMFSVACNDLADEPIDRINLPGDRRRPLVAGTADRRELIVIGVVAAVVSLAVSATFGLPAVLLTTTGLAVSAGYSIRPVRLADRGAIASLVLPACYVAVPYLLGRLAAGGAVHSGDLTLLTALYVSFIGRILLKDFRDVRGDELFGKRTFLVRHGARWTCAFSACCWTGGTVLLAVSVRRPTPAFLGAVAVGALAALALLYALARTTSPRSQERYIAAIAVVGRGVILELLAHLSMTDDRWSALDRAAVIGAIFALSAYQTVLMIRRGPISRLTTASVPATPAPAALTEHVQPPR
jgi:4-hydroxybenzoate polyprenyltransferase